MDSVAIADGSAGIESLIDRWVAFLEVGDYDAAFEITSHHVDGARSGGDISYEIEGYSSINNIEPYEGPFRVTAVHRSERERRCTVNLFDTPNREVLGTVLYGIAINETLTDLTATFRIIKKGSEMGLQLESIHVM